MKFLNSVKEILEDAITSAINVIIKKFDIITICFVNLIIITLSSNTVISYTDDIVIVVNSAFTIVFSGINIVCLIIYMNRYNKLKFDMSLNESIYKDKDRRLHELEFEVKEKIDESCQLTLNQIFDLYEAGLAIRKYRISKYHIDPKTKEMHIYCNMSTYTKMNLNREILPTVKYHIEGTNVVI